MGRKNKKSRKNKIKEFSDDIIEEEFTKMDVKLRTKKFKKKKRKNERTQKEKIINALDLKEKLFSWHKIVLKNCGQIDAASVCLYFKDYVEIQFMPLGCHRIRGDFCFYLENDVSNAQILSGLTRRITNFDGRPIIVTVTKVIQPDIVMNSDITVVLQQVLSQRFSVDVGIMDLNGFHRDPLFIQNNILLWLGSEKVLFQVFNLILEKASLFEAFNLSDNSLQVHHCNKIFSLLAKCPNLKALNLSNNNISSFEIFKMLKKLNLVELCLDSNKVLKLVKSPEHYIKLVRKQLPLLKILDKIEVDGFLREKNQNSMPSSSTNETVKKSILTENSVHMYVDQYVSAFDSTSRHILQQAYTPDAVLELQSTLPSITSGKFEGHLQIIEQLALLPATLHIPSSMSLTILSLSNDSGTIQITGKFVIGGATESSFRRIMTLVPYNAGFCCSHDVLILL